MKRTGLGLRTMSGVLVVIASIALVGVLTSGANAHRIPGDRHLWRNHLAPQAKRMFFTKSKVTKRIEAAVSTPSPDVTPPEQAAADDDESTPVLFPWVEEGGVKENWWQGLGYAVLGLLGAMITIYLFLGESLPSMGGKADYDARLLELEDFKTRRDKVLRARESFARGEIDDVSAERLKMQDGLSEDYDAMISQLETQLSKDRWRLYLMGFPMYLILGGSFAVLFASNALQAILIGFGWTALADRLGLKRELEAKKEKKDKQIQELEDVASEQTKRAQDAAKKVTELQDRLEASNKEREILRTSNDILTKRLGREGSQKGELE